MTYELSPNVVSILEAVGLSVMDLPYYTENEILALDTALSLVFSELPVLPSVVTITLIEKGFSKPMLWQPFEYFSHDDIVNVVWQFQEAIYETMMKSYRNAV
jgi:hypothetical protein